MSIVGGSTAVGKRGWVTPLCWAAVLLDGFDLVVLGTVIPVLLEDKVFGITPDGATAVATTGLIGMTIGAMTIGTITDYLGRRKVMIFAVFVFSIFTLAVAFSTSLFTFGTVPVPRRPRPGRLPAHRDHAGDRVRPQGQGVQRRDDDDDRLPRGSGADRPARPARHGPGGHGWRWMFVIGGVPGLHPGATDVSEYLPESEVFLEQRRTAGPPGS